MKNLIPYNLFEMSKYSDEYEIQIVMNDFKEYINKK